MTIDDAPTAPPAPRVLQRIVLLLVLLTAAALSLWSLRPPQNVAPDSGFDTELALRHLTFIAKEARPVGSPHHRAVREYLVNQFQSLGCEVQVQDTKVRHPRRLSVPVQVMNVIALLPGTAPGSKAVMLAAHYDSTRLSAAPGAGDDGAACAALLEVARILASQRPKNDVIFLITDAEELGLYGARGFVQEHPYRERVGVVFNFEARGTSGPSIMFETSERDAFLVDQYARVAPHPIASSLSYDVYRLMPNDTDFTIFRNAGMKGLNFAFIGDYANYHTANDNLENLDVRSMRHHGVQALALARHFGNMDLDERNLATHDSVYFNLFSLGVVRYAASWVPLIATVATLFAIVAIVILTEAGQVSVGGLLWGWMTLILSLAASGGAGWVLLRYVDRSQLARQPELSIAGFALMSIATTSLLLWIFWRRDDGLHFAAAGLVVWVVLTLLSAGYVRGGSYLFAWPTLFASIGMLAAKRARDQHIGWIRLAVLGIAALPAVILLPPVTYLAFLGLRIPMAPVLCAIIALMIWPLVPQVRMLDPRGWLIALVTATGAAACFALALAR
jgi:hypothetical protein